MSSERPAHYRTRYAHNLSPRQQQILALIAAGLTNAQIGDRLGMTLDGAKWHVSEIIQKLGVNTREEAARLWRDSRSPAARFNRIARGFLAVGLLRWTGVAAGLVGASGAAWVAAAAWSSTGDSPSEAVQDTASRSQPMPRGPAIPSEGEVIMVSIQGWSYYDPNRPVALPLERSNAPDRIVIETVLEALRDVPEEPLSPEGRLTMTPKANFMLTDGRFLNVQPGADCVTTVSATSTAIECVPVPGVVDVMAHGQGPYGSDARDGFARFASTELYEWVTEGWKDQVRYGTQDDWNAIWDSRLILPTPAPAP